MKRILDRGTLQTALDILGKEVQPDHHLPDSSPEYRRGLAQALFYRVSVGGYDGFFQQGILKNSSNGRDKFHYTLNYTAGAMTC